jgi:hypothetical protein
MLDAQEAEELLFVWRQIREDLEVVWNLKQLERWNRANSCYTCL